MIDEVTELALKLIHYVDAMTDCPEKTNILILLNEFLSAYNILMRDLQEQCLQFQEQYSVLLSNYVMLQKKFKELKQQYTVLWTQIEQTQENTIIKSSEIH